MAKKRRTRTRHPGVKIIEKAMGDGKTTWLARWTDPDSGRRREKSFASLNITTREARTEWAITKHRQLSQRRAELAAGQPKRTRTMLDRAADDYLEGLKLRRRPGTVETYSYGIDKLKAWTRRRGVTLVEELTGPILAAFREHLSASSILDPVKGGKRGQRKSGGKPMSPASVNSYLRTIKALVNHWRKLGLTPKLDRDKISDSLAALKTPRPELEYLDPDAIKKLITAALAHDAETFKMTRAEHDREKPQGSTLRYDPITPFVMFMLLSGCRIGEALALRWDAIDLMAPDDQGQPAGEIRLEASSTKTGHARRIDLSVSPALRSLLSSLKERSTRASVFGWSRSKVDSARKRLMKAYGAPSFTWQALRQTTGTFLTCAPSIFGAASAYRSAKQLGHSVTIAERHYVGVIRGIPREASTLEAAMGVEDLLAKISAGLSGGRSPDSGSGQQRPA